MSHEYLFSLTLYRDGTLRLDGHPRRPEDLPEILRTIALALEDGAVTLAEYQE